MIQSLRLQQFRSYTDGSFEFDPGVNIIVGPNASGKTNLLEALLVLAQGSSYRVDDAELVMHGRSWARLDALVDGTERTIKLVSEPAPQKTYEIDGRSFQRLSLERTLPVVLFEPTHLDLVAGSPERRREHLDTLLSQTIPGYGQTVRAYRRTLAQRNRLLKSGHASPDQLFPWDVRLAQLGAQIVRARMSLISTLDGEIRPMYHDLAASPVNVALQYSSATAADQYESVMLHHLESKHHDDIERGFTSFGPHRDDLLIYFDEQPAHDVASRGEMRTLILALKILELQLVEARRGTRPLLLLDDVFSELDGARRRALTIHLQPYQTFITTTDADVVAHHFAEQARVILVGD
jgi:DNA replication and repair protein RecF